MNRVYTPTQFSIDTTEYYDNGLGTTISNKFQQQERIRELNDKHGMDLVEVGNEKVKPTKRKSDYSLTNKEMRDINQMLGE
jgi:hypothetical protein